MVKTVESVIFMQGGTPVSIRQSAAIIAASCILVACATISKEQTTIFESRHSSDGVQERQYTAENTIPLLNKLAPYADLAEAVYRRDFDHGYGKTSALARKEHGCDYVGSRDETISRLGLPEGWVRLDNALIKKFAIRDENAPTTPLLPCRSADGLNYETYIQVDSTGKPLQATISFRGTENTRYQWTSDWIANFSHIDLGFVDNPQYQEARQQGSRLIKALARILPKVNSSAVCLKKSGKPQDMQAPIYLVGHSLGGGLAQHLAFYSDACDVIETITFDPSPATGWFYLVQRRQVQTSDPQISRVYLDDEALSFVRKISTKFNLPRDFRVDYKIVFPGITHNTFGLHSMTLLATNIRMGSSKSTSDGPRLIVNYDPNKPTPETSSSN
jgi:hypothetical protein